MNANRRRGEVIACFDGKDYRLRLTLGGLAELEDAFQADNLADLVGRFTAGTLSARDMIRILGAGLRGGGHDCNDAMVAAMTHAEGAAGFANAVSGLLLAAFGAAEPGPQNP